MKKNNLNKNELKKNIKKRGTFLKCRDPRGGPEPNKQHKSTRNIQTFHTNPTMREEGECEEGE